MRIRAAGGFNPTAKANGERREVAPLPRGSAFLRYLLLGLDAVAFTLAWVLAATFVPASAQSPGTAALTIVGLSVGGIAVFSAMGLYRSRVCNLRAVEFEHLVRGCLAVALVALAIAAVAGSYIRPREIAFGSALAFLLTGFFRSGYRMWLTNRRRSGGYLRPVLIVGGGAESAGIATLLGEHPNLGYRLAGVLGSEAEAERNGLADSWCGDLGDGLAILDRTDATGAIICARDLSTSELNHVVQLLLSAGTHVQLSSGLRGIGVGRLRPSPLAHEPLFYVERASLASWQLFTKRSIDFTLASLLLVVTLPLLALAAIGIKAQDRGPVLFKQQRVGRGGKPFLLYKLRTMRVGAESQRHELINVRDGPLAKFAGDPRVTKLGRFLRTTSIDELPQLWNVLNGTMSLVGPRPALPDEVVHFDAELRARESVWPGITGLWQVEGRDNPSFAAYRRFDLFYVQNWSVALDLMILVGTVESVVARIVRGITHLDEEIPIAPPEVRDPGIVGKPLRRGGKPGARLRSGAKASSRQGDGA